MSATALLVELLIIGFGGLLWIALGVIAMWGVEWVEPSALSDWSAPIALLAIAAAYIIGLLVDSLCASIFDPFEKKICQSACEDSEIPVSASIMRLHVMTISDELSKYFENRYNRSRLLRATAVNGTLSFLFGYAVLLKEADVSWESTLIMLGGLALVLGTSLRAWTRYVRRYFASLEDVWILYGRVNLAGVKPPPWPQSTHLRVLERVTDQGQDANEDLFGNTDESAWMLDGATQIGKAKLDERSDARWLVKTLDEELLRATEESPVRSLPSVTTTAVKGIVEKVKKSSVRWEGMPPSCTCALLRLHDNQLEYFVLGDVTLVLSGGGRTRVIADTRLAEFDEGPLKELRELQAKGHPFADARREVDPKVQENRMKMNSPNGYWVISSDLAPVDKAVTGSLKLSSDIRVLLATDGFARIVDLFHTYANWNAVMRELDSSSLQSMLAELRSAEEADDQCTRFPRLAPKDDATAALIEIAVVGTEKDTPEPAKSSE